MLGVVNLPTSFDFREDMMTMTMVGVSQSIPYAGQNGLKADAARADAQAASQARQATEVDLANAATVAYISAYYRRETLNILYLLRALQEQVVASARGRLTSNQAAQEDVSAAQAGLWRIDTEILSAEQETDAAWLTLSALRGAETESEMPTLAEPSGDPLPADAEPWLTAAREHYPPLRRLDFQAESYSFSADASRRMRWPMLGVNANYGFRRDSDMEERDDMVGFGLTLSLPVFRGRQEGRMARSMDAMAIGAESERSQMWRTVRATLGTLYRRADRLQQSLLLYRDRIIPSSDDAFRSALAGYDSGRTSFITLLNYAVAIQRDRITANRIAEDLARTRADAQRYTTDPSTLTAAAGVN
jgi:outer membrane protein TolC